MRNSTAGSLIDGVETVARELRVPGTDSGDWQAESGVEDVGTLAVADPTPSPTPTAQPDPTPSPTPTAQPDPTPSPTPTSQPDPTPSPTPTSQPDPTPSPTPTAQPDPTPSPTPTSQPDPTPSPGSAARPDAGSKPAYASGFRARAPDALGPECGISVVMVSHNEGENLRRTVKSFLAALPAGGELIVVDDHSTDGSAAALAGTGGPVRVVRPAERLGVARSRNFGASHAGGDVLVFSDAHVDVPDRWWEPFLEVLAWEEVGAVGPVVSSLEQRESRGYGSRWRDASLNIEWLPSQGSDPYPVPLLVGCFTAARRDLFEAIGGFDAGMDLWGSEDGEMSLRLWSLGYECLLVPAVEVAHLFRSKHPYAVDWEPVLHNMLRMAFVHFNRERLRRIVEKFAANASFPAALARVATGDVWLRRAALEAERTRDDDWFFRRFGMDW
jgi:GT2 family glycosyltransferase